MNIRVVRAIAATVGVLLVAACGPSDFGEERLDDIEEGVTRDSALGVLGTGPLTATGADTVRVVNGFRRQMFVSNGKTIELVYYREAPGTVAEEIDAAQETPVVLEDGKVIGHGWKFYSKFATENQLPIPPSVANRK